MRLPGFCVSVFFCLLSLTRGQIDRSICVPVSNISDASPIPALSESYSTTVEWKLLHNNSTISIDEYVIGMEKLSSIRITQEGHTSRIIYDEANQQYTMLDIVNNQCTTQNYVLDVVLFGNEIWKSTTKQLYQILKQSITVYGGYQTIRSTVVQSWSTCVYLLEYNVTLSATIYFAAEGWPMPFAAPNAMVPVRLELRGSYNNNQTRFHAVGDYVNFLPTPPTNLDNVQIEPGMFCAGRDVGMPILPVPTDFSTVIERVNIHDKQVTYETIWFDSRRKFVRYETKSAGGDDVDPTRIVFDFYDGVRYSIDPYTSSCDPPTIIERGDKFVDQTASPITRIQMQSSLDFFKLQNATVQYVGKRYTRKIFCDVWVGLYYDLNIGQNQTVEWYFLGEGWQEGIGTSITPGSLVRFDVWAANSNFPIIHNVHKLNPSQPYLTAFEIGPCFTGPHKRNFVIKFATSGLDLSQVSLNYIRDQIQEILTTQAQLDNLRFSNVAFENFGANDWYFTATLLDKSPVDNNNIFPPVLMKEPLNSAFGFLTGYVDTPWVYNITQPTLNLRLTAMGILPLYYPYDFTTTTTQPTTTGTFLVPTLPVQTTGTSVTTAMPTPPAPPTGPTVKVTTQTTSPTTKLTTSNRSEPCKCPKSTCPNPTTCPTITCPVITTPRPMTSTACPPTTCKCPKVTCPSATTQKPQNMPVYTKVTCPPVTPPQPCTTPVPGSSHLSAQAQQQSSKGVNAVSLPSQNNQHNQHEIRALFRPVRGTSTSGRIKKQKKRRTWTCEFICLSETDAMKVPTREEKLALVKAGLGSKKIQFNADDTEELFQQKLIGEDGFSKLSDCGVFEIMRCISNCRNLEVISCRRTPEVMKSFVGCQSKLYIRPIQRALSLEADNSLLTEASATITEKCCHCEQIIPIDELRDHVYTCVREKELCSDQIMNIVIECSSPHESQYYSDDLPDPEFDIYNAALTATNNTDQLTNSAIPVPRSNETVPVLEPPVIPSSSIASTAENSAETSRTEARTESYIQEPNADLVGSTGNSDSWKYETISNIIKFCSEKKIEDPIEILKIAQDKIIKGRKLELESESGTIEGATNFILVDRENLLETAFVEIKEIVDLRNTLEVQFYEENAVDLGGPRREFFTLVLRQIQEHYFDPVREYSDNYEIVGKILALSMLQSGPLPRVLSASLVEEVFNNSSPRAFVHDLRRGLDALCLYELACHLPTFIHLFTPRDRQKITLKLLTSTIKPQFSPEGSNRRQKESKIYAKYVKYLREAASGRRGDVTLAKILRFCTGSEEEPPLGYQIQPTMEFVERQSFLPTGNTCINKMQLTIPVNEEPTEDALFNFFDFAFCNSYFGLQ